MKKKVFLAATLLGLSLLTACGSQKKAESSASGDSSAAGSSEAGSSAAEATGDKVITVGASPSPHAEILEAAKDALKAEGYELKLMTLNGDTISSGARHAVKQDVSIVATFQVSPVSAVGSVLLQEVEIPNPFSESLTVHRASRVYGATLLTPFGQVIATIEPRGGDERLEFATASLPSGLYILRLTDAHGRYRAFKVVKE